MPNEAGNVYYFRIMWLDEDDGETCDCWCDLDGWHHQWGRRFVRWYEVESGILLPPNKYSTISDQECLIGVDLDKETIPIKNDWHRIVELDNYLNMGWFSKLFAKLTDSDKEFLENAALPDM